MKKGRHRRYEEARKFQRELAGSFDLESFDLDAPDPFALPETGRRDEDDDQYAEIAARYADPDDEVDEED